MFNFNKIQGNKRKVISNVGWASAGKIVRVFTELLVSIFVARYLGPAQYGLMNYVISYVTIYTIISVFGLDNIEIREMAKPEVDKNVLMGTSFGLRIMFAIITYLIIIGTLIINRTETYTSILILIYSLSIILSTFNVIRNYFTAIVFNKYIVIAEMVRCLLGTGIKILLLLFHASLIWFIIALTFDFLLVAWGYKTSYHKYAGSIKHWRFDKKISIELIIASFPLLLSGAAVVIYQRIDQVIIKSLLSDEAVGFFSVATRFSEFILFVPLVISQTISPLLVRDYEHDKSAYIERSQFFLDLVVWSSFAMAVIVSLSSYMLIRYTFGIQYLAAVPVLQIIAFKTVGMGLANSTGQLIVIENKQKWAVIRNIIGCIICVASNYLLIPIYGIIGSAWATLITIAFSGYIGNFIIKPYRHFFYMQTKSITTGAFRIVKQIKI